MGGRTASKAHKRETNCKMLSKTPTWKRQKTKIFRKVVTVMTKPIPRAKQKIGTCSDRIRQIKSRREKREPIRPDGLVRRSQLVYHQEEGPVGPDGLP